MKNATATLALRHSVRRRGRVNPMMKSVKMPAVRRTARQFPYHTSKGTDIVYRLGVSRAVATKNQTLIPMSTAATLHRTAGQRLFIGGLMPDAWHRGARGRWS